ncbi:hypothetical protein IJX73_02250 [bacterium]|nr:hypothetical protein [bacterium]MBQ9149730.1 hypothetical protein [bacterium]
MSNNFSNRVDEETKSVTLIDPLTPEERKKFISLIKSGKEKSAWAYYEECVQGFRERNPHISI